MMNDSNYIKKSGAFHFNIFLKLLCIVAIAIMPAAFSSCALLPTEDEPLAAPVLNSYERRQPTMAVVRRDNLVQTKTISCRSRPIREQSYSFPVGGIYIHRAYFTVGDTVHAGDMLAELDRKDILTQVEEARIVLRKQEFALELAMDDTALKREEYIVREQIKSAREAGASADDIAELQARYDKALESYQFNVSYAEKMLEIAQRKLDMLLTMAEERVIYATIDGVVSYAYRFNPEDRSVAGDRVFTISDASELIYAVSGNDALFFTPGEIYTMKISKTFLDIRAISPEDLGEPPPKDHLIYFIPDDLTSGLASYGYITVETNRRDNVLYLPANSIIQVGDEYAVYRVGESGFRELSRVEIGVTISGKTEIISGLSEGDEVILD